MSQATSSVIGRVASLHLHPTETGAPLTSVNEINLVAAKGIQGEPRYFGKISRRTGQPSRRQVSLIEREQIAEHAAALGLQSIAPGRVRANIETEGIDLVNLIGKRVKIGEAILFFLRRPHAVPADGRHLQRPARIDGEQPPGRDGRGPPIRNGTTARHDRLRELKRRDHANAEIGADWSPVARSIFCRVNDDAALRNSAFPPLIQALPTGIEPAVFTPSL